MSEFNYAIVLDGQRIAAFNNTGQAENWIRTIAEQARTSESVYTIVPFEDTPTDDVQAYKDRVYDAAIRYASDPTCSVVQDFLDDIGIDRERYAETATFTVVVRYDDITHGPLDAYQVERAIEDSASFEHYGIEVSSA